MLLCLRLRLTHTLSKRSEGSLHVEEFKEKPERERRGDWVETR